MTYPLDICAKDLCKLLSSELSELSTMELAIRKLLSSLYSREELEALRESACLTNFVGHIQVASVSKPSGL